MTEQETLNKEQESHEQVQSLLKVSNRLPQLHATVSTEIFLLVHEMATKEKRTLSAMASILIERGLKEKIRLKEKNRKTK